MSNSIVHTESWIEPFIWFSGVDCSNSVNHEQVKALSYNRYSFLFLPVIGIKPATSWWVHSELLYDPTPSTLRHVSLPGSRVRHQTSEEGRRAYRSKRFQSNNKDEVNSSNILSNKTYTGIEISISFRTSCKRLSNDTPNLWCLS